MVQPDPRRVALEAAELLGGRGGDGPLLVAIHVEEACGVVLPDELIASAHLGSPEAIERTVRSLSPAD